MVRYKVQEIEKALTSMRSSRMLKLAFVRNSLRVISQFLVPFQFRSMVLGPDTVMFLDILVDLPRCGTGKHSTRIYASDGGCCTGEHGADGYKSKSG